MTMSAIEDALRLLPWIESNSLVHNDPHVEERLLAALGGPIPPELAGGMPLLRHCNPDVPAVPLIDVAINGGVNQKVTHCDRCDRVVESAGSVLLVPMGASVIAFHCCRFCQLVLNEHFVPLVWGATPPEGHVRRATDAGWGSGARADGVV